MQDVLIEQLTVVEHLLLVAAVKGVPGRTACKAAAQEMAAMVGLGGHGSPALPPALPWLKCLHACHALPVPGCCSCWAAQALLGGTSTAGLHHHCWEAQALLGCTSTACC